MRRVVILVAVLAACNGKKDDGKRAGVPKVKVQVVAGGGPGAAAGKGPSVTRDGKPVEIVSTYAVSHGGSAIELVFSSYPTSCHDAAFGMEPMDQARMMARVTIAPQLGPDGKMQWGVAKTYYRGGNAEVSVPVAGGPFGPDQDVKLTLPHLEMRSAGEPKETVTVEGPLEVKSCGADARDGAAKPRPQADVTFSIAGQTMPILGAVLQHERGDDVVRLATGPLDCQDLGFDDDVVWELYLTGGKVTRAQLRGAILDGQSSEMLEGGKATATIDGTTITIAADYDQTGYAIEVNGKVDAVECK
jgi:hypothetical protein